MSYANYNNTYRRNKIVEPSQLNRLSIFLLHMQHKNSCSVASLNFNDGKKFRYCKDSGTGNSKCLMNSTEAIDAQAIERYKLLMV